MTYEQYWYDDPLMVRAFYKADKLKQSREDFMAWLSGAYIKRALESTVGNMFLEKGKQPFEYPEMPIFSQNENKPKLPSAEQEEKEKAQARLYMLNMVRAGKDWGKH